MKTLKAIVKLFVALAAIAGAVYVVATYGDKIVAWAKKLLESCPCKREPAAEPVEAPNAEEAAPAEEAPAAEEPAEEVPAEESPVEEPVTEDGTVVATEEDFEN